MGHSIAAKLTSDAELLEASRRGEHAAFGELVGRYQHVVSAVSYSRTRDHALGEDVAQETFLAAWRQLHQLREPGRLRSWLCGIARNLAGKAKKRSTRDVPVDGEIELVAQGNPFEAVCAAEAERVVGEALARVPETYRDVLVLHYQEHLSVREVSEALGISEAAALQRLSRGRQYLANGVTSLVEKSLRRRPRRDLVVAVVAALPTIKLSRAEAATHASRSHGGSMFKLAAVAALIAAGTTTAVIVHKSTNTEATAAVITQPTFPPPTKGSAAVKQARPAPAMPAVQPRQPHPGMPPYDDTTPAPEVEPSIDAQTYKRLKLDQGPSRGPVKAPVTIVMFTDLKCPFCSKVYGTIDQLFDEYPGKLRLVIKQLPVHSSAELAAEAALAAEAQGKFWELDELMIANPDDLSKDAILALAGQGGLDVARLRKDLEQHAFATAVEADKATAAELEIRGTPSFVINGRKVVGALPIDQIRRTIEASLKD
jgi:RNA polymerase sigma factor (sigma-70 family)